MSKADLFNINTKAFFALLRAGLWETDVQLLPFGKIVISDIYRLAEEQSVQGLVLAGLNHVVDTKITKQELLRFIGATFQIEERNKAMNGFIGDIVDKMRKVGIYTLLVKGQGVALYYERPLWRSSGDVDFYLSSDNYEKAKLFFRPLVASFDPDNATTNHINMHYGPWVVELHANQHVSLSFRINHVLDEVQNSLFHDGKVRCETIGGTTVFLPSPDNDVIIVFTHFLNHFYKGGIGVRQICDWCRLLWTFKGSIERNLLFSRLKSAGMMTEWKAFGAFAVEYLGMPSDAMPFYENSRRWTRKSLKIKNFIINVGNFGHNRGVLYNENQPRLVRKALSYIRRVGDLIHHTSIFPRNSLRFLFGITINGIRAVMHGE